MFLCLPPFVFSAFFYKSLLAGGALLCLSTAHAQSVQSGQSSQSASPVLPAGVKRVAHGTAIEGAPELHKYVFANGLKLLVLPDDRNPVASLRIMLNAGSNRERLGATGLAHFFEHMMFRKTKGADEGTYDRTLAGVGGNGNAATSTDYVVYESTFPGPALEKMLDVESARFLNLDLQDPYFSTEKGAVVSERKLRYENDPQQRANEILRAITERGTPYEWLTIGSKKDVEQMSIKVAQDFYDNYYRPDNATISIGGPFKPEQVVAWVAARFANWKGRAPAANWEYPSNYLTRDAGKTYACSEAVMDQSHNFIFPTFDTTDRSAIMALVFTQMLNDHPEGLFQRRLAKSKLATGFGVYKVSWQKKSQPVLVSFKLNSGQKIQAAEAYWWEAFKDVLRKPLDARIKKILLKQVAVDEAEQAGRMTSLLQNYEWSEFMSNDFLRAQRTSKIISSITQAEFRTWAQTNFNRANMIHTAVVPTGLEKPCSELVASVLKKTANAEAEGLR